MRATLVGAALAGLVGVRVPAAAESAWVL